MSKLRPFALLAVLSMGFYHQTTASLIIYNNQENYLAGLSLYGYDVIREGFESNDWASLRYPAIVKSITVQELTWSASDELSIYNSLWTRSGTYGIFDTPGQPDGIFISSTPAQTIFGAGGWFNLQAVPNLYILLDGVKVYSLNYPTAAKFQFIGAIQTDGVGTVSFATKSGNFGADDFSFGVKKSAVPEPATFVLLLCGFIGLGLAYRSHKKAVVRY
jgi:hypothetical protein